MGMGPFFTLALPTDASPHFSVLVSMVSRILAPFCGTMNEERTLKRVLRERSMTSLPFYLFLSVGPRTYAVGHFSSIVKASTWVFHFFLQPGAAPVVSTLNVLTAKSAQRKLQSSLFLGRSTPRDALTIILDDVRRSQNPNPLPEVPESLSDLPGWYVEQWSVDCDFTEQSLHTIRVWASTLTEL